MKLWLLFLASLTASSRAFADQQPLVSVILLPDLVPGVVRQLLPIPVELPGSDASSSQASIVDMVYCGADGHGGANALAVLVPGNETPPLRALSRGDCDQAVSDLATKIGTLPAMAAWFEVVKLHVTWNAGLLRLELADVASAGKSPPSLGGRGQQLTSYPTSHLKILPPPADRESFDAALGFRDQVVIVALLPDGQAAGLTEYSGDSSLDADISAVLRQANVLAKAQYVFINRMLKAYAPQYAIPIPIQGTTQTMVARNVQVSGGDNIANATGELTFNGMSYNCRVRTAGADLVVRQIELEPVASPCAAADAIEQMRCQGQQALMAGSSGMAAQGLTNYYQGTGFHYSATDHPLRFNLGDREFIATFEAMRSSSKGSTFSEAGRLSVQRAESSSGRATSD